MKSLAFTPILAVLALAAAPSLTTAQTNTFPASGNVGIGTTSPAYKLDISGGATPVRIVSNAYTTNFDTTETLQMLSLGKATDPRTLTFGYMNYFGTTPVNFVRSIIAPLLITQSGGADLVLNGGNVGIGTTAPTYPLTVNGTVRAKEVIVNTGWSDYVFAPGYRLAPLSEIEQQIKEEHHLSGIPSSAEVKAAGINIGEMQAKLLAKVEELTLHQIEQEKRICAQQDEIRTLKAKIAQLSLSN